MLEHALAVLFAAITGLFPSHVASSAAPLPVPVAPTARATIIFGGDMMFDRTIRTTAEKEGGDFLFDCIDPTLQGSDLVLANLEGPITASSSRSVGSAIAAPDNFIFTFPTSTAPLLAAHGIRMVNLGNNHIMNFGQDGVRSTTAFLSAAGVEYFGDPLSQGVAEKSVHSVKFAFINYNEFEKASSASTTINQIKTAHASGEVPIVYTHWGIEYATTSPARIKKLAHEFVDAGAELVVGSHPHVVEEHEEYRGVDIYYSLGNFIFDQYWNSDVSHGLLLRVAFTPFGVAALKEIPIELGHDRRTCSVTE